MKISIQKISKNYYIADCIELPGAPPIGQGKTKDEAVKILLLRILSEAMTWHSYLNFDVYEEVFGRSRESHKEQ
jgi:hypothetical protein